jgi:DNA-directed RNA polymerase specialized sigma24 family protein
MDKAAVAALEVARASVGSMDRKGWHQRACHFDRDDLVQEAALGIWLHLVKHPQAGQETLKRVGWCRATDFIRVQVGYSKGSETGTRAVRIPESLCGEPVAPEPRDWKEPELPDYLTVRERLVVRMRLYLEMKYYEIGRAFCVSGARMHQVYAGAIRKMQRSKRHG